ncbi:MBL fold metallo-hydrolase [bacterium]|nr:MBL fold metallo-hydrolase [bacterium]MCI0566159.1 MBL fold metallo-hydrolase [bacterium]
MNKIEIKQFRSGEGCLSYIVYSPETKEAAAIDITRGIGEDVTAFLAEQKLSLIYIFETHTHADHFSFARELQEKTGAKIYMYEKAGSRAKDMALKGGEELPLGNTAIKILHTPGHAPDAITLFVDGSVFTGDTILIGGTGRTDLAGGNSLELYTSIRKILEICPDETTIYPGHDYKGRVSSVIEEEKKNNPRLPLSEDEFVRLMDAYRPPLPKLFDEAIKENTR